MPTTAAKLTTIVEDYLADLRDIRDSGGATGELSYHTPLNNLLAAVGATLKPKVRCVGELRDMGAGRPTLDSTQPNNCSGEDRARGSSPSAASSRSSPPATTRG